MTRLLEIESSSRFKLPELEPKPDRSAVAVAHVVLSLEVGGLERVVVDLAREGVRLGQKVSVLCLERMGNLVEEARDAGAAVACFNKRPGIRLKVSSQIATHLRELKPDVVHTHQVGSLFYAGSAAHRAGVPVLVHTEHGKHYSSRFRTRMLGRFAARRVNRFFCVSGDIALEARRCRIVDPGKIVVLPNGIDISRFHPRSGDSLRARFNIPADSPVIGTVGRLSEIKQQHLLLRALAELAPVFPSAHLLLVGDGPLRQELQRLADGLDLGGRVHFAGYQAEPESFLAMVNVFAISSRSEGMPLSVLEAWASGLPVVASAVGGLPELIGSTGAGLLFPTGDVAALASRLSDLLADEQTRLNMGRRGRQVVEQSHSVQRMAGEYHRHYLSLLGKAQHARIGHH
jgi:glycosyltransferase involved in cell wall biosynthesis